MLAVVAPAAVAVVAPAAGELGVLLAAGELLGAAGVQGVGPAASADGGGGDAGDETGHSNGSRDAPTGPDPGSPPWRCTPTFFCSLPGRPFFLGFGAMSAEEERRW